MPDAGPPPVGPSAVVPAQPQLNAAQANYLTIVDTLKANRGAEAKAIQAMFGGDRKLMDQFLAVAFSALQSQPKLLTDCDPMSLIQAIKDAASLGLTPMTEDAAIIPYGRTAKLMPMWRGYVKRIRNSREVVDLDVQIVYMNDKFELQLGTNPQLVHVPILVGEKGEDGIALEERGDYRGCYAWALMPSGKYIIEWMTTDDLNYVRDHWGNLRGDTPWKTSWGEMARKTVIRRLAKRLPAAAVDRLLALDKQGDEAAEQLKALNTSTTEALDEVRQLALRAVGQIGPGETPVANTNEEPTEPPTVPEGQADTPATAEPDAVKPSGNPSNDPGADPNLQAALSAPRSAEEEQLARQRAASRRS